MLLSDDEVKIEGKTKTYNDTKTDSGNKLERIFCERCGCPVLSISSAYPGMSCTATLPLLLILNPDYTDADL